MSEIGENPALAEMRKAMAKKVAELEAHPEYGNVRERINVLIGNKAAAKGTDDYEFRVMISQLPEGVVKKLFPDSVGISRVSDPEENAYFSLRDCLKMNDSAPVVQHLLDLLKADKELAQLNLENPLEEEPIFDSHYEAKGFMQDRLANSHLYADKGVIDLAALAYIQNLVAAGNLGVNTDPNLE